MDFGKLSIPVIQAPIGSVGTVDLAAAVSNAGGIGSLAMTWLLPDQAIRCVKSMKQRTNAPFIINFVLEFKAATFEAVVDIGVPAISLSWGHAPNLIDHAHKHGITVGVQIGSVEDAVRAIHDGADFIICQGMEAGGHVQSAIELENLLPRVVAEANDIPVVAAGGLADGADMRWALEKGAVAAMLGTRFVATRESAAHNLYKAEIVRACGDDTSLTYCFDGGWPRAAHRVIRNRTLDRWEAAGSPPPGIRPGEGDVIAVDSAVGEVRRYDDTPAMASMTGDVLDCCLYAGRGVDRISDIPDARELVFRLFNEYHHEIGRRH